MHAENKRKTTCGRNRLVAVVRQTNAKNGGNGAAQAGVPTSVGLSRTSRHTNRVHDPTPSDSTRTHLPQSLQPIDYHDGRMAVLPVSLILI